MAITAKTALLVWIAQNRGVFSKIARAMHPPVTSQFVSQVARGQRKSKDGKVERELKKMGAPI
jgi:hypothetical protein